MHRLRFASTRGTHTNSHVLGMPQPPPDHPRNMSKERVQLVNELHAPARRNFPRRHVVIRGYDDLWQADLVEMRSYAKQNRGYHYILTIIDAFRKYAWAIPVKTKSGHDVEFYNAEFQRCVKTRGINHYSTYSVMKASIVECFNRTLKNLMWKQCS